MRITFQYYKNSVLASIISIFGCVLCYVGVIALIYTLIYIVLGKESTVDEIISYVITAAWGIFLIHISEQVSKKKEFKKWLQMNAEINLEDRIKASADFAVKAYNSCPNKYNLKFITDLNPEAGAYIVASIGKSVKKKHKKSD